MPLLHHITSHHYITLQFKLIDAGTGKTKQNIDFDGRKAIRKVRAMPFSAMQCNAMQCNAMQCNVM